MSKKIKKNCEFCGKEFEVYKNRKDSKFCSIECYSKSKHKNKVNKICDVCGKDFFVKKYLKDKSRFCCRACFDKFKKKEKIKKICGNCGGEFEIRPCLENKRIFCSKECKFEARKKEKIKKICVICGDEFDGKKDSQCCSVECSGKFRRKDKIRKVCEVCANEIYVYESRPNKRFCSKQCYSIYQKQNSFMIGKRLSDETKKKISDKAIGRVASEETKKKISDSHKGKPSNRKKDKIKKICAFCSIEFFVNESVKDISKFCSKGCYTFYQKQNSVGHKHSEESKIKISESKKGINTRPDRFKKDKIKKVCKNCEKIFLVYDWNQGAQFCSRECCDVYRRVNHPNVGRKHSYETKMKISQKNKGKTHTTENRKKMSENRRGKFISEQAKRKISEYQKKLLIINYELYDLVKHQDYEAFGIYGWRKFCLNRDEHKCMLCGSNNKLEVHHIAPQGLRPDLRYNVNNGISLCHVCHFRQHPKLKFLFF